MGISSSLLKLYFWFEDRYYSFMDFLEKKLHIPVYGTFVSFFEKKGIPSFPVALLILLAIAGGAYLVLSPPSTQPSFVSLKMIVSAGGAAIEGATISITTSNGTLLEGISGTDGSFVFTGVPSNEQISILIDKEGYPQYNNTLTLGPKRLISADLSKPAEGSKKVEIRVMDGDRNPISGASLDYSYGSVQKTGSTDAAGKYALTAPSGTIIEVTASKTGYLAKTMSVSSDSGSAELFLEKITTATPTPIVTPPTSTIVIFAYDGDGNPIEAKAKIYDAKSPASAIKSGISVSIDGSAPQADKKFIPNFKAKIVATKDGYEDGSVERILDEGENSVSITLKKSTVVTVTNATVVTVEDAESKEPVSAHVYVRKAYAGQELVDESDADSSGKAEFDLVSGTYYAIAVADGYVYGFAFILPGEKKTIAIYKATESNSVNLLVNATTEDNAPANGAAITLYQTVGSSDGLLSGSYIIVPPFDAETYSDGTVLIENLPKEWFTVAASSGDMAGNVSMLYSLSRQTESLNMTLFAPRGILSVNVTDVDSSLSLAQPVTISVNYIGEKKNAEFGRIECSESPCDIQLRTDKKLNITATSPNYNSSSKTINPTFVAAGNVSYLQISLFRANSTTLIKVTFDGLFKSSNSSISAPSPLVAGAVYYASFTIDVNPKITSDKVYLYAGIGNSSTAGASISAISAVSANYSSAYSDSCALSSGSAKWFEAEFNRSGSQYRAQINLTSDFSGTLNLSYRAYAVSFGDYIRDPSDSSLNTSRETANRSWCSANTKSISFSTIYCGGFNQPCCENRGTGGTDSCDGNYQCLADSSGDSKCALPTLCGSNADSGDSYACRDNEVCCAKGDVSSSTGGYVASGYAKSCVQRSQCNTDALDSNANCEPDYRSKTCAYFATTPAPERCDSSSPYLDGISVAGKCASTECGKLGQSCCVNSTTYVPYCKDRDNFAICDSEKYECVSCGGAGDQCCPLAEYSPNVCQDSLECAPVSPEGQQRECHNPIICGTDKSTCSQDNACYSTGPDSTCLINGGASNASLIFCGWNYNFATSKLEYDSTTACDSITEFCDASDPANPPVCRSCSDSAYSSFCKCGAEGQSCCPGDNSEQQCRGTSSQSLSCVSVSSSSTSDKNCQKCGGKNQACCNTAKACDAGFECSGSSGTCIESVTQCTDKFCMLDYVFEQNQYDNDQGSSSLISGRNGFSAVSTSDCTSSETCSSNLSITYRASTTVYPINLTFRTHLSGSSDAADYLKFVSFIPEGSHPSVELSNLAYLRLQLNNSQDAYLLNGTITAQPLQPYAALPINISSEASGKNLLWQSWINIRQSGLTQQVVSIPEDPQNLYACSNLNISIKSGGAGILPSLVSSCKSLVFKIDSIFPADAIPLNYNASGCGPSNTPEWKLYNQTTGEELSGASSIRGCFDEKNGAIRFNALFQGCPLADQVVGNDVPKVKNLNITFSCPGSSIAPTSLLFRISSSRTPIRALDASIVHYKDLNLDLPNEPSSFFGIKETNSKLKAVYLLNNRQVTNNLDSIIVGKEVSPGAIVVGTETNKIEPYIPNELLKPGKNKGSAVLFGWMNSSDIPKLRFFANSSDIAKPLLDPVLVISNTNALGFKSSSLLASIETLARKDANCKYDDEACLAEKLPQARLRIFQEKATATLQKSLFRRGYVQTIYCANSTKLTQDMVDDDSICKDSYNDWFEITPVTQTISAACNPCNDASSGNAYYAGEGSPSNGQPITADSSKPCDSRCDCNNDDDATDECTPSDYAFDPANQTYYTDADGNSIFCTDPNVDSAANTCHITIPCSQERLCQTEAIEDSFPLDCDQCSADGTVIGSETEVAGTPIITWLNESQIQAIEIDRPAEDSVLEQASPYSYFYPNLDKTIKFSMVFTENNYAIQKKYAGFTGTSANTKSNLFPQRCDARQGIYVASLEASISGNAVVWKDFVISNMSLKDVISASQSGNYKECTKVSACNLVGVSDVKKVATASEFANLDYPPNSGDCFNFDWPVVPKGITSAKYVFDGTKAEYGNTNSPKCPSEKKHFTLLKDQKSKLDEASICLKVSAKKKVRYKPFDLDILNQIRYFQKKK